MFKSVLLFSSQRATRKALLGEKKDVVQLRTSIMGTPINSPNNNRNLTEQPRFDLRRRLLLKKAPSHPYNPMMGKRENIPNYSWLIASTGQTSVQLAQSIHWSASIV